MRLLELTLSLFVNWIAPTMQTGFETIGNAILTLYDNDRSVLVTDPWFTSQAYFGSWGQSHEIPEQQLQGILGAEYVWLSHGHPDHLNAESMPQLAGKKILLPDHVGAKGFSQEHHILLANFLIHNTPYVIFSKGIWIQRPTPPDTWMLWVFSRLRKWMQAQ